MRKLSPLNALADRIHAHLKRMEADPVINAPLKHPGGMTPYYDSVAYQSGSRVCVKYVCFQGTTGLTKGEAESYLAWLDAGNNGKHYQAERKQSQ